MRKSLKERRKKLELPDETLLKHFLETKDAGLLGELYHRYIPLVYGLALKYLGETQAAQDAVMDVFELLVAKISQYEIRNFKTWLYSVAKNHCLHVLRKEKQAFFIEIEESVMEKEDFFTLIEEPQTQEETEALAYCLTTLPEEQQKSIHFFYMEEKSYADIVDLTGFSLNKVKSYIQNGKRNLKNCLIKALHIV